MQQSVRRTDYLRPSSRNRLIVPRFDGSDLNSDDDLNSQDSGVGIYRGLLFNQLRSLDIPIEKVEAILRNSDIRNVGQALDAMDDPMMHRWAPDRQSPPLCILCE